MIDNERITEARKLTNHDFIIIPLNDKIAIIKYKDRRKIPAISNEIDLWFSNDDGRIPRANGIAIAINNTEFGIDTDGEKCESIFLKIISKLSVDTTRQESAKQCIPRHHMDITELLDIFPMTFQME